MARQGLFQWDNVGLGLTKWGLIMFNVAFWCLGVVSLGIGLWLYVQWNEYASLTDGQYLFGSAFLIAVGFGAIIVGFLGIIAAIWESNIIASFFGLMILLAFGMYMTSGIWALVNLNYVDTTTANSLQRTMAAYQTNQAYADGWNSLQSNLDCCGIDSYVEWSTILLRPRLYPSSCCSDLLTCQTDPSSVYTEGCLDRLVLYEEVQLNVIGPIGLAFGLFQIFGMLICILFCITVRNTRASYYT